MDGMLNMYSNQVGFTLDDFVKANKGDLAVTVTDLTMKVELAGHIQCSAG